MKVAELIERLKALRDEQDLPIIVHDGLDPSDSIEAEHVEAGKDYLGRKGICIE